MGLFNATGAKYILNTNENIEIYFVILPYLKMRGMELE